jgi:hypothetical protein
VVWKRDPDSTVYYTSIIGDILRHFISLQNYLFRPPSGQNQRSKHNRICAECEQALICAKQSVVFMSTDLLRRSVTFTLLLIECTRRSPFFGSLQSLSCSRYFAHFMEFGRSLLCSKENAICIQFIPLYIKSRRSVSILSSH